MGSHEQSRFYHGHGTTHNQVRPGNFSPKKNDELVLKANRIMAQVDILKTILNKYTFQDQYFEMIRKFLIQNNECSEIIMNNQIAITDRIAYMIRFCSHDLNKCLEE